MLYLIFICNTEYIKQLKVENCEDKGWIIVSSFQ